MIVVERFKGMDLMAMVFYPLAVILMEAFWVSPWLSWIGHLKFFNEARPVLHLPSVIIIILVSLVVTRVFVGRKMSLLAVQAIIIGSGLVTMLLVLGVEYTDGYTFLSGAWITHAGEMLGNTFSNSGTFSAAIPVIVYLWWRGIMLGQSTTYFKDIYRSFLIGMGFLILLIIFWKISGVSSDVSGLESEIGVNIIAFFFFGLLAVAICHLYNMRSTMPKEEANLTSVWRWMPVMLGVIGGMVIVGFGVAFAISPDFIDSISSGVQTVIGFLGTVLGYIVTPIIYIIQGLVIAFKWFVSLFPSEETQQMQEPGGLMPEELREQQGSGLPPIVTDILKWAILVAIIALVIFLLAKAIGRYRRRRALDSIDEVRESIGGWNLFKDDLNLLFKSLGDRFKRKPRAPSPIIYNDEETRTLDVREIYRRLQWEAGQSGMPRRKHQTAAEYARHIEHIVPDSRTPLDNLTDMYEKVRYGEYIAPKNKLEHANGLWQNLKGLIRKLRGA